MDILLTSRIATIILIACFASACATQNSVGDASYTPIAQCSVYEGQGETTEYLAELGVNARDNITLGIQGFHPGETSPQRITAVVLSNGERLRPRQISNECTCGVKFRRMDEICGFITVYEIAMEREWLEGARRSGLSMLFELENGLTVTGPELTPQRIDKFLSRLD